MPGCVRDCGRCHATNRARAQATGTDAGMQRQRTDRDGAGGNIGICLRACGKGSSKKLTIFGYKRHLLITLGGVILNFELAPANAGVPSLD